jgi:hypothetical protein
MKRRRNGKVHEGGTPLWMLDLMFLTAGAMAWLLFYFILRSQIEGDKYVAPEVITSHLPQAYAKEIYQVELAKKGTCAAVTWHLVDAPKWLTLDSRTGVLRGTAPDFPPSDVNCPFTIGVRVSSECSLEGHATKGRVTTLVGEIRHREEEPPALEVKTTSLPIVVAGQHYSVDLSAVGGYPWRDSGVAHYEWKIASGEEDLKELGITIGLTSGRLEGHVKVNGLDKGCDRIVKVKFNVSDRMGGKGVDSNEMDLIVKTLIPERKLAIVRPNEKGTLPESRAGQPFCAAFSAVGGQPPYTWSLGGVETLRTYGLVLDDANGILSAMPLTLGGAATDEKDLEFTVTVRDMNNRNSDSTQFRLPIRRTTKTQKVELLTKSLPDAVIGYPYKVALSARYGVAPYTWTVTGLPGGFNCDVNGVIEGRPALPAGKHTVEVKLSDGAKESVKFTWPLVVRQLNEVDEVTIVTEKLPDAIAGEAYDVTLAAKGGRGAYEWSLTSPAGNSGLTVLKDGHIRGIPNATAAEASNLTFEVSVKDADRRSDKKTLKLAVRQMGFSPRSLRILTSALPKVIAGDNTRIALSATGGVPDYVWTGQIQCAETIRPYVTLSQDGVLEAKIPEWEPEHQVEKAIVELAVCDSQPTPVRQTARLELTVIGGKDKVQKPSIPESPIPAAIVGRSYKFYIPVRGGIPPYAAELKGVLPQGLTFDRREGCIYGQAQTEGTSRFRVVMTDARGDTAATDLHLDVIPGFRNAVQEWWKYFGFAILVIAYVILKQGIWDALGYQPKRQSFLRRGMMIVVTEKGAFMDFDSKLSAAKREQLQKDYRSLQRVNSAIVWTLRLGTLAASGAYAYYLFGLPW